MKYILTILISFVLLYSSPYDMQKIKITKEDKRYIYKQRDKKKIIKRLKEYFRFIKKAKFFTDKKKLNRTNHFINNILSVKDNETAGTNDHWATRKEFLISGKGDCEDYAIAKYFTLKELYIDPSRMYLAVVKVKNSPTMHMVLLYFYNKYKPALVLDNLKSKVLPLNKRRDLIPKFAFNEIEARILKKNGFLGKKIKINWGQFDKWKDLLNREKSNVR